MKKVLLTILKVIGGIAALCVVAFIALAFWVTRTPKIEWSKENLTEWIETSVQFEEESAECKITGEGGIEADIRAYFENEDWQNADVAYNVWEDDQFRYYRLADIDYTVTPGKRAVEVEARFTYETFSFLISETPVLNEPAELVRFVTAEMNSLEDDIVFGYKPDTYSEDELHFYIEQALYDNVSLGTEDYWNTYIPLGDASGETIYEWITVTFGDEAKAEEYTQLAMDGLDTLEQLVRDKEPSNDRETYRAILDVVCANIEYDDELLDITLEKGETPELYTPEDMARRGLYGAVVLNKTVCSGYAAAYQALCERFGLDCCKIIGISEDVNHVWNMVRLDGERYYVDSTYVDNSGARRYFLFTDEEGEKYGYIPDERMVFLW